MWAEIEASSRGMDSAARLKYFLHTFNEIYKISSGMTVPFSSAGCNSLKPEKIHLKIVLSSKLDFNVSSSSFQII